MQQFFRKEEKIKQKKPYVLRIRKIGVSHIYDSFFKRHIWRNKLPTQKFEYLDQHASRHKWIKANLKVNANKIFLFWVINGNTQRLLKRQVGLVHKIGREGVFGYIVSSFIRKILNTRNQATSVWVIKEGSHNKALLEALLCLPYHNMQI